MTPQLQPGNGDPNVGDGGDTIRAIQDVAFDFGLSERDARKLLLANGAPITKDYRGRDAVPMSVARQVADSHEYAPCRDMALTDGEFGSPTDSDPERARLRAARFRLLDSLDPSIDALESIHRRYLESAHRGGFESSAMAQYLLLSRAIALLRALRSALAGGHYYSLSMMRDIDECLDLAHFFVATDGTDSGAHAVRRWFREGHVPSHRDCRKTIARFQASRVEVSSSDQLALMTEIYRKKSKHTHPSFLAIRDLTRFGKGATGELVVSNVTYGRDEEERRLYEAAEFFRTSVLSTAQTLCISLCATIGCDQKDADDLVALVKWLGG